MTPHFLILDSTLFRLDSAFWLDSTLKLYSGIKVELETKANNVHLQTRAFVKKQSNNESTS